MGKITGLGGVFLELSGDTKKLMDWYRDVLGVDTTEYGINFLEPNKFTIISFNDCDGAEKTVLNFTVDDLGEFMESLKKKNVKVLQDIETYDYGKFARIEDVLGGIIELWEPFDEEYIKMVEKEIKEYK